MSAEELGPGQKVCPYCAEVIKAAAIKCRFCQSDLPEPEAAVAVPTVAEAEVADEATEVEAPVARSTPPGSAVPGFDVVVAGLMSLCLILTAVLAVLVIKARPESPDSAGNGQVTDSEFRSAAMSAAAADATRILSYSYKTLEEDQSAARDLMTTKFADEYDDVMKAAATKATSAKLTQKATVQTTALISITKTRAVVLLYVSSVTTAEGSTRQQLLQNRVRMTLERKDGDWAVSKMAQILLN